MIMLKMMKMILTKTKKQPVYLLSGCYRLMVAELYGVETKRVNEAVKNNSERFSDNYSLELNDQEKNELVENFDRFTKLNH